MVPGTNSNAATSLPLAAALARRWRTHVVDVPGQPGLSAPTRPPGRSPGGYGTWLGEVLDQLARGPVVVVGHSLGGGIALACASPHLAGRVLLAPAGLARLRVTPRVLAVSLPWLLRPDERRGARLLDVLTGPGTAPRAELATWLTLVARSCRSSLAPAPLPGPVLERARAVPNAVATGEHDVFLPPRRLTRPARARLGVPVRTLPGAGHLAPDTDPALVAGLVAALADPPSAR
ncbi:alpha/beta hydrolase [Streptomyces sp. TRM70308]|uniref:alpha/beta fold hydrolase n=1 Tax=Streptomyces sp. TRM70308 TaxID=3131932 RepID=UPI003D01EE98